MNLPPSKKTAPEDLHAVKDYYFTETAEIPNNLLLPLLIYRKILNENDLAAAFEKCFTSNRWIPAWRHGVYPFAHYHSTAHEVIGVFRGTATILFGHAGGIEAKLGPGDAAVIPAGTGHQCIFSSEDFQAVGAYPDGTEPDLIRAEAAKKVPAKIRIDRVPLPDLDPILGVHGPLMDLW